MKKRVMAIQNRPSASDKRERDNREMSGHDRFDGYNRKRIVMEWLGGDGKWTRGCGGLGVKKE